MSRIVPSFWNELAAMPNRLDALGAKLLMPSISDRVYAAVDGQSRRHILVLLASEDQDIRDVRSRGLSIDTVELSDRIGTSRRFADIVCLDVFGHEAFDLVASEVASAITSSTSPAVSTISNIVSKWRRFWNSAPSQVLTREEAAGLFAELFCLRQWVLPFLAPEDALDSWRGPLGARQDFQFAFGAIEVKATLSSDALVHRVHGLEQLQTPASGQLRLLSVRLVEEPSGDSLPDLIASIEHLLEANQDALAVFEGRLLAAEYRRIDENEYRKTHYRVALQHLYSVEHDFPRILPSSFSAGLPGGVTRVDYEIVLNGFPHLIVATSPSDQLVHQLARQ